MRTYLLVIELPQNQVHVIVEFPENKGTQQDRLIYQMALEKWRELEKIYAFPPFDLRMFTAQDFKHIRLKFSELKGLKEARVERIRV